MNTKLNCFKRYFLLLFFIFITNLSFSQNNVSTNNAPTIITLKSKVLNEERKILISLPKGYDLSNERYPVLFILDSKTNFNHAFGTESYLSEVEMIPKHIVVGIEIPHPLKDLDMMMENSREAFSAFVQEEVIPHIDKNYRTQPFKILFGHSISGTYALYILLAHPENFNSYIVSSPYDKDEFNFLSSLADQKLPAKYVHSKYLLIMAGYEPYFYESIKKLTDVINKKATQNLLWYYTILDNESYSNSALITLYNGLQYTYGDYKVPTTLSASGNLDSLKMHFNKLSFEYGYELKIPEKLLIEFGFQILNERRLKDAIEIFKYSIETFPDSPQGFSDLGIVLEEDNQLEEAEKYFTIAYEKSLKQDSNLTDYYKDQIEKVKQKISK